MNVVLWNSISFALQKKRKSKLQDQPMGYIRIRRTRKFALFLHFLTQYIRDYQQNIIGCWQQDDNLVQITLPAVQIIGYNTDTNFFFLLLISLDLLLLKQHPKCKQAIIIVSRKYLDRCHALKLLRWVLKIYAIFPGNSFHSLEELSASLQDIFYWTKHII